MSPVLSRHSYVFLLVSATLTATAWAESKPLLDLTHGGVDHRFRPSSEQAVVTRSEDPTAPGVHVTISPGDSGYPGVALKPDDAAPWDLSAFGHIEARIVNTTDKSLHMTMRVDNAGNWKDNPWNTESTSIKPGQTAAIKVIFGHAYGHKPGFPLNPAAVTQVMIFTGKTSEPRSFRIESIQAAGPAGEKPLVDPKSVRLKPTDGVMLGQGVTINPETQLTTVGVTASAVTDALTLTFPPSKGEQKVTFKPAIGCWDLRDHLDVRLTVRNAGQAPITPRIRIESNGGPSNTIDADAALVPGEERIITVPFAAAVTWQGPKDLAKTNKGEPGTGTKFASDAVSAITMTAQGADAPRELQITSIVAGMPELQLPDWLGQRPPVEGDWVQTFAEEFDSEQLDPSKWGIYGSNFWDKKSHFSKGNVILSDGMVRLRFEKKHGHHNDDPTHQRVTDYATGYLHTYGKWTQLYGYFEARMKLPTAPGLWPAFWMMPDRGNPDDPQWKRQDTASGGMEFDIMEHLTRWGPNRYTIAMHWDGYNKDHKVTGAAVYARPDKDGFIVAGLLWEPGLVVYYCNGQEVARWVHPRISNVPSDLMFTLPMGGWDNSPLDDATLPDDFVIDYVRVWQRKDLASQVDGPKTNEGGPLPPTK